MSTFAELANQDWRIKVDTDDSYATVVRPDPDRRGFYVGPLATVPVGMTTVDDDGDEVLDLTADDGRNLFAITALPQLAGLVKWIEETMGTLNAIHFDSTTEAGQFHRELRARCAWIRKLVDERPEEAATTEDNQTLILPGFMSRGGAA